MIRNAPVIAVTVKGTAFTVPVEGAELTLDESWSPYGQLTLDCPAPGSAVLAALDPRTDARLAVTLRDGPTVRTLDLGVRVRSVDYLDAGLHLEAATDEAMLQDRGHAGAAPDEQYRAYEANLRALINASALHALPGSPVLQADAGATADLTIYTDSENLLTNPSAEVDTAGWTATACALTRLASGLAGTVGANVFRLLTPTSNISFMLSSRITVIPGTRYVLSGVWMVNGTPTGTASGNARMLTIVNPDAANATIGNTPAAAASGQRVSLTWTCPAGVTSIQIRAFLGYATTGDIRWDALMFKAVSGAHDDTYFDGDTPDTAVYRFDWTGTAHASTSKRTNISGVSRGIDTFTVYPGTTWWDYVEPLVQAAGLRLYCDERQRWHLVNPETWLTPGGILVRPAINLEAAEDAISRDADTWASAVVVHYAWVNSLGVARTVWDVAGTGSKVFTLERTTPYPGPGAAAAILNRMTRRGHLVTVRATSDVLVAASQPAAVELPDGTELTSAVAAVTLRFPDGDMDVTLRDPIETPPSAWLALAPGESWLESPIGESWLEEVV